MSDLPFNFLQDHSMQFLEMAFRTDKMETPRNPDGVGERTGVCGDTIAIYLVTQDERIVSVTFRARGCINTMACANTVSQLAEGLLLADAWEITPEKVIDYLQTLPEAERHCAELAVGAFYLALTDCEELRRNPWKRAYRKF